VTANLLATECALLDELVPNSSNSATKHLGSYRDLIIFVKDRSGHDVRYAIDASKIECQLDWVPTESFETCIRKTVESYLNNENWWQRVISGEYQLKRIGDK